MHDPTSLHRREWLFGTASLAMGIATGCSQQATSPVATTSAPRQDIPLRLALFGSAEDAEAIRRGWGAITDQELDVQITTVDRSDCVALGQAMLDVSKQCDVMIYPLMLVAVASREERVVPLSEQESEQLGEQAGRLFPAARNAVARFAGEEFALPLGCSLPTLLAHGSSPARLESWEAYDELVSQDWDGSAAEPSAAGWAGAMFLWRTASLSSGLFSPDGLYPLIGSDPFQTALELMVRTDARYSAKRQTPQQIWDAIAEGKLKGGIGFPPLRSASGNEIHVGDLPGTSDLSKVLLDPFSPVISLSANCRQSASAKNFIGWISGGEGSQAVRRQVVGMTDSREQHDRGSSGSTDYDVWLAGRLQSPLTAPTLQLLRAGEYYSVLDEQVRRALDGESSPADSLQAVAKKWQVITEEVGVEKQQRTWRRAQGMRA